MKCIKLIYFSIINDQVAVTKNDILNIPREIIDFEAKFKYNDESMNKCVECKSESNTVSLY